MRWLRWIVVLFVGLAIAGILLRPGLVVWVAAILGTLLLLKLWRRPALAAKTDIALAGGLITVTVLAWAGTWFYVMSVWESGEVVELAIDTPDGVHTARVWVMDMGSNPVVFYDAEPPIAKALLSGQPLGFTRAGKQSSRIPRAAKAETLPEARQQEVLDAMAEQYGERNSAATVYYLMLGRLRHRVPLVIELLEP